MKDYNRNKKSSYLKCWDVDSLYGCETSQKLPLNGYKWAKNASQFNEDFIKNYNEESDTGHFELMLNRLMLNIQ